MSPQLTLGKYQTIELLGRGGFATVYKAKNTILGNEVVLKILDAVLAEDETFVRRFQQEAQQTVRLDHPNIVRVLDLDKIDDKLFIVMEYVPGLNLRDLLAKQSLSIDQAASIVRQIGAALDYAHSRRLVHRDVKPSNIMVRDDGQVKLFDFGIVKAAEGAQLTLTGTTIGTPAYMSPEQSRGSKVDGRSDLYSLGIMTFELITGQVPFQGDTAAVIYKQIHEQPPLPSTYATRAKGPLEPILLKALAKKPANRYQTGTALAEALATAVNKLQNVTLAAFYQKTVVLMEKRRFSEAISELESLNEMHPGYQNASTLLQQARQGLRLSERYQKAADHLGNARQLAAEITAIDPDFPDADKVFQTFNKDKPTNSGQHTWFWLGAVIVITAYFSSTWVWVTARIKNIDANIIEETRVQLEGLSALFARGFPWVAWLPLICIGFVILLTLFPASKPNEPGGIRRPPIDQTEVLGMKAKKRPSVFVMMVAKWLLLLGGLVGALFLVASVHNKVGPITIAVGCAIMLLADILSSRLELT